MSETGDLLAETRTSLGKWKNFFRGAICAIVTCRHWWPTFCRGNMRCLKQRRTSLKSMQAITVLRIASPPARRQQGG